MRLLVDANLSPRVAATLTAHGHDADHVQQHGLLRADDMAIALHAAAARRVIVTSDSDFGTILARTSGTAPSVIRLRHLNDTTPERQVDLIEAAIDAAHADLEAGCIVTISRGRLRVRTLPIG